ncbi:MAG TPA: recombinase family protein [Phycisphaerae bacterium]|nr:recombinase family protein [Phycisphaerae bacterium]
MTQRKPIAASYARVSSQSQADRDNLEQQRVALPTYAAAQGWKIVGTFEDAGISGTSLAPRAGAQALMQYLGAHDVDFCVVVDPTRWGRPARDWEDAKAIIDICWRTKTALRFLDGTTLDPSSPDFLRQASELLGRLYAAGHQSVVQGQKVRRAKLLRLLQGQYPYALSPYGFALDEGRRTLKVVSAHWQTVRGIFRDYAAGSSQEQIAAALDAAGVSPSRRRYVGGGSWSQMAVRYILGNEIYRTGRIEFDARKLWGRYRDHCAYHEFVCDVPETMLPADGMIRFELPKTIPAKLWAKCEARRGAQAVTRDGRSANLYLFRPFLTCGHCGRTLEGHTVGGYGYYRCLGNCSAAKRKARRVAERCDLPSFYVQGADAALWDLVWSKLLRFDVEVYQKWLNGDSGDAADPAEIEGRQADVAAKLADRKGERKQIVRQRTRGKISDREMDELLAEVNQHMTTLDSERIRLDAALSAAQVAEAERAGAAAQGKRLAEIVAEFTAAGGALRVSIDRLPQAKRRDLLARVLDRRSIRIRHESGLPDDYYIDARHEVTAADLKLPANPLRVIEALEAVGIKKFRLKKVSSYRACTM